MIDILIAALICSFAGYASARTIIQESMFGNLVTRFVALTRHQDNYEKEIFVMDSMVMQRRETSPDHYELVCISESDLRNPFSSGWKHKAFYPISVLLAKIGDLFGCIWCLSAQLALQFYFWTFGFWAFVPVAIPAMLAAAAITFAINDWINPHNKD